MATDWQNLHVSREEYNQSLRDSVNAYYEYAMNHMPQEEAIQSTAEMAERYETEMEAFDTAQANAAAEESASVSEAAGVSDEGGVSEDGGVNDDGGIDDGGIE